MNFELFLETLPYMLKGLAGVFFSTAVIIICVCILNKITNKGTKNNISDSKEQR
ncbi:MAG: hypothetical protein ACI4QV_00900 [Acutalibacteraceae bacterium]